METSDAYLARRQKELHDERDRLLQEARDQRARCLELSLAGERLRRQSLGEPAAANDDGFHPKNHTVARSTTGIQRMISAPSLIRQTSAADDASRRRRDAGMQTEAELLRSSLGWTAIDDTEQIEALQTIQELAQSKASSVSTACSGACPDVNSRIIALELSLRAERAARRELEEALSKEQALRKAAQQQVLILECELDRKESELQEPLVHFKRLVPQRYSVRFAEDLSTDCGGSDLSGSA